MSSVFYNKMIRKTTVAFGDIFTDISCVRYNPDGTEQERFVVPIDYATKELYVMRLEGDPNLDKKVQMTLPRMSYEMNGLSYDSSRKQITNMKNFFQDGSLVNSNYTPVPYNFDFSLYLYVRNIEDGNQIIEHILPYFAPDYTVKLNMIPEMGVVKEVPVILNSANYEVTYEGDRDSDTRMVIWTLNFTVKSFIFGATSTAGLITTSITNIYQDIQYNTNVVFNLNSGGTGNYQPGEMIYQGATLALSTASAQVVSWSSLNDQLLVQNIQGNFVSNQPLKGAANNASWTFNSYNVLPKDYSVITSSVSPSTANANSTYTYTTTITETT
jgi:hypothetical protein